MPGVTISASFGAEGSVIAPAIAKRLGLHYMDRAISGRVAQQLGVSVAEANAGAVNRSLVDRVLRSLAPLSDGAFGVSADHDPSPEGREADRFRSQSEQIMREAMATGAVILGRGGSAAFIRSADVLRVRLYGPVEARIAAAARVEGTDIATARKRLPEVDRARAHYVRRLYGVDIDDSAFFHLQLDTTAIPRDTCLAIIEAAYHAVLAAADAPAP
ncbi:MAG: cytidylate kinase-like family protein [Frankiaceae bacterium]|jgi:cytidylate kinase|nr:cytidylate kinase-like family protein [Frankiaceae bacterium]